QDAARRDRAVHRFLGETVLAAPGTAVQIEHRRKRPRALRFIDAGHQLPSGLRAPELYLADLELELRRGTVRRLHSGPPLSLARPSEAGPQACADAGCTECCHLLQKVAARSATLVHAGLLAKRS